MNEGNPIRVLLVDDHPMVQDGLQLFISLSSGLECVGKASSGEEALRLCGELQPDVVLMDLVMPGMGGIAATQAIRQRYSRIQVVALTSFVEPELVEQALKAGAIGYVLKNVRSATLADAIRSAYEHRSVMAPEAKDALVEAISRREPLVEELSERELEILALVGDGYTNSAIGQRLHIAESTVRFHISNILAKLGAHNRAEAVRLAIAHGLIKPGGPKSGA